MEGTRMSLSCIHIPFSKASFLYKAAVARTDAPLLLATTIISTTPEHVPHSQPDHEMRPLPKPTVPPAKWPLGRWVPQSAGKNVYNREEREALARGFIAHMDHHLFGGAIVRWYCERDFPGIAVHALNIEEKPTLGCAYPSKGVVILFKDCKKSTERNPPPSFSLALSCCILTT